VQETKLGKYLETIQALNLKISESEYEIKQKDNLIRQKELDASVLNERYKRACDESDR